MARIFLLLFVLFSASDLINVWFELPFRQFTKSMIIPLLIGYFISRSKKVNLSSLFIIALIFAWLGDVFLLFSGTKFFLLGLGSFLVMQFIYSFIFYKNIDLKKPRILLSAVLLCFFSIGFNIYLWPYTSEVRIPVIIYSIAIALMAFMGINRQKEIAGYDLVFAGVILFVISDTVLGINSFASGFWKGGFVVMLTYILAQYCIVEGYSKYLRSLSIK